jgi:hypothetical protein
MSVATSMRSLKVMVALATASPMPGFRVCWPAGAWRPAVIQQAPR